METVAAQALSRALNAYVGRGRIPYDVVSTHTMIESQRLRFLAQGRRELVHWWEVAALMAYLPPEFSNILLAPVGRAAVDTSNPESSTMLTTFHALDFGAAATQKAADGRICRQDIMDLFPKALGTFDLFGRWIRKNHPGAERLEAERIEEDG